MATPIKSSCFELTQLATLRGLASLLHDDEFSDLTLTYDGKDFKTHRSVVCPRSPVIKAACRGSFAEGQTRFITVCAPSASIPAIERMLQYLYTREYNDGPLGTKSTEPPTSLSDSGDATQDQLIDRLMNNVHVYCLADYYQIYDLKYAAWSKSFSILRTCSIKRFAEVIVETYAFTSAEDRLRRIILSHACLYRRVLMLDGAFMEAICSVPDFVKNFARQSTLILDTERNTVAKKIFELIDTHAACQQESDPVSDTIELTAHRTSMENGKQRVNTLCCRSCGSNVVQIDQNGSRVGRIVCSASTNN